MESKYRRIGFVSTRLAGTDGVSLETAKWVQILEGIGHQCFYFAGESDWPAERTLLVPEAHFDHPEILPINGDLFDDYRRSPETSRKIHALKDKLVDQLHRFVKQFDVELLIAENALSLPMNIPLGLALTELIAETSIPTIAHHHDFHWERARFSLSAADDYLGAAFPPTLYPIRHVVINSFAARQLALRTGLSSAIIPNVMNFETRPPKPDEYGKRLKSTLGLRLDECLLLQPTRIVPRKRIEVAIELARRLDMDCTLVISHHSGDEGARYEAYLREVAHLLGVKTLFAARHFAHTRDRTREGQPIFSLADAYLQSNLVTYPSKVEGFGNAFLETIYYRKPIVMSTYEIFRTDIQPKGFRVIGFGDFVDDKCVRTARRVLQDPDLAEEIVDHNFELARHHYSYEILERGLSSLISECMGI